MIRAYQRGDGRRVRVQKEQVDEACFFADEFDNIHAYTLCDEHIVYAVFGWEFARAKNVAVCYALLAENCGQKLLELIRFLRKEIKHQMPQQRVEKLLITVKKNFTSARRLAHILGFTLAAELPHFFLDEDYQLFERK